MLGAHRPSSALPFAQLFKFAARASLMNHLVHPRTDYLLLWWLDNPLAYSPTKHLTCTSVLGSCAAFIAGAFFLFTVMCPRSCLSYFKCRRNRVEHTSSLSTSVPF